MAHLGQSFDPNAVPPSTGGNGGVHPTGDHEFEIRTSEVKANSGGSGTILKMEIFNTGATDPALKDKKVFVNINMTHEKAQVQSIGQGEFSALCAAIGETGLIEDSEQLHYRPFYARIGHEQAMDKASNYKTPLLKDDGTPFMNAIVKRYLFEDGEAPSGVQPPENKPAAQAAAAPPPQQAAAPAAGARTWKPRAA